MITLCAVGDLMLGDSEKCIGFGTGSIIKKYGRGYPFAKAYKYLKSDIVIGNLEAVISETLYVPNDMNFSQMRTTMDAKTISKYFDIINIANNHIMQHGENHFNKTVEKLRQEGVGIIGMKGSNDYYSSPYFRKISNTKLAFVGYSFIEEAYNKSVLYAQGIKSKIISDITKLKGKYDKIIVSCHWGDEFINRPPAKIIKLARKMIDSGADIIIGHHPHVIQPIELYNDGIIAYSLGNFISDMAWDDRLLTGLAIKIAIDKDNTILSEAIKFKNYRLSQPEYLSDETTSLIKKFPSDTKLKEYAQSYRSELQKRSFYNRIQMYSFFLRNHHKMRKKIFFQIIKKRLFQI